MADYNSSYTGPQIDNAVGAGLAVRGVSGIVKSDGSGNISRAVPGVDYQEPGGGGGDLSALYFDDYDTSLWTIGTFSSANGTTASSTTRIRTEILPKSVKRVTPKSGYKAAFWVYDASGTYQGVWNGTAAVKSVVVWFTETVDFSDMPTGSQVRVLAADTSDSTITASTQDTFAQGIIFTRYTDDSLSHDGYPADAYATGRGLYRAKNRSVNIPAALTYWDIAEQYESGCTPADVPINSYTETSGARISGFSGLTIDSSTTYLLICFVSYHLTSLRWYILIGRTTKECYIGRSSSSGSAVNWTDFSPMTRSEVSNMIDDAIVGAIEGSY